MKLSFNIATIAAIASLASTSSAFNTAGPRPASSHRQSSSALNLWRSRFISGGFIAPEKIFRDIDDLYADFDDFFNGPFLMRPAAPFFQRATCIPTAAAPMIRPGTFKIREDKEKFQLAVNIPGVKASDLDIQVEKDGRLLRLSGVREVDRNEMAFKSRFDKAFLLDRTIDTSKITANLADGILTIDAPKKTIEDKRVQQITITEKPPVVEEGDPKKVTEEEEASRVPVAEESQEETKTDDSSKENTSTKQEKKWPVKDFPY